MAFLLDYGGICVAVTDIDFVQELLDISYIGVTTPDWNWEEYSPKRQVQIAALEATEAACEILHSLSTEEAEECLPYVIEAAETIVLDCYSGGIADTPFMQLYVNHAVVEGIGPAVRNFIEWAHR